MLYPSAKFDGLIKLMNSFKSYWSQTKNVTTRNMMRTLPQTPMDTWFLCVDHATQKAGTFIWGRGNNATNIYTWGLCHYKELSIVIIPCLGFKALPYISHQIWASVVKEPDSVAYEQQRCRPVCASSQSDACLCNLLPGKYIAKQLNLAH